MKAGAGLLFIFILLCSTATAGNQFQFSNNCVSAYNAITSLRLKEGETFLAKERLANPGNTIPYLLENYIDFFRVYLHNDRDLYEAFVSRADKRINAIKSVSERSAWGKYMQAEIGIHKAFIELGFKDYTSALWNIRRSYKLLEENIAVYPDFQPNKKSMALLKALLGIIPSKYHWGLQLLGMDGNLHQGMNELKALCKSDYIFWKETVMVYAMLQMHLESKPQAAWQTVQDNGLPFVNDAFSYFIAGNIALYSKHTDKAIAYFGARPSGQEFESFPYIDYLTGVAFLNKLDAKAEGYFLQFLKSSKGSFIKASYQKLAWLALAKNNQQAYWAYITKAKKEGTADTDADKDALKEAESGQMPNINLLKARLLFDGGYYDKAQEALSAVKPQELSKERQLEWQYRKARIYDESGKDSLAIVNYKATVSQGKSQPLFYAANAALQIALIYERLGDRKSARYWFSQCLELDGYEYENSIHQKARAGLQRVK
ncbi:MAG: hypothetical protein SFW35_00575 [Chitinophagales bacterium]|nr:hypothetical protein [Chitinophagales bacterium]